MGKDNKKIILVGFVVSYIFIVKPINKVIKLKREKRIELKETINLIDNNKILKKELKSFSKEKKPFQKSKLNLKGYYFRGLGEYNDYINFNMKENNIKTLYIGRSILKKNSVIVSFNLKGKLYDFVGFLNKIEKEKKIYLSSGNFYIEKKGEDIIATINLEGNIFK